MQTTDYFVWDIDPSIFKLGPIHLPFEVSIFGLLAAAAIFAFGYPQLLSKEQRKAKNKGEKGIHPNAWKTWGLGIGALLLGQLIFSFIPSPGFQQIGPLEPRWYGLLFASAFVVGYLIGRRMMVDGGLNNEQIDRLLMYIVVATVVGARLGHVIFYDLEYYLRNPSEIIAVWHGGLASHGAAAGILLAIWLFAKKNVHQSFLWLVDRVVIVVALGGAFVRTGNFINSEIVGKPTDLPWGIIFPTARVADATVPRHPTMLYEALLCIILFALLWYMYKQYKKTPPEGSMLGVFLVVLFSGRFLLEFTKVNQAAFASDWAINMGQWLSIPLIAAGIWLLWNKVNWKDNTGSTLKS